jgi:hypothetical protein
MGVKVFTAGVAVAVGTAAFAFSANAVAAKPAGLGAIKAWHGGKHFAFHHRRAFRRAPFAPFFTGFVPSYYGDTVAPFIAEPTVQRIDPQLPPPYHLSCGRSRELVSVPSESGGERKIVVTRC